MKFLQSPMCERVVNLFECIKKDHIDVVFFDGGE